MAHYEGYDMNKMRDSGRGAPRANPNQMTMTTKYQAEWEGGKKIQQHMVETRLAKEEEGRWPPKPATKRAPPPGVVHPREGVNAGMRHYEQQESTYTNMPLSIHGRVWDTKRHVLDENGQMLASKQSGVTSNYFGLFGSIRRYGDPEKCRTHSHKQLLFPTTASVNGELAGAGGPSSLHICDEWEAKIMSTQGRPSQHASMSDAMTGRWGEMKADMQAIHGMPVATTAHTIHQTMALTRSSGAAATAAAFGGRSGGRGATSGGQPPPPQRSLAPSMNRSQSSTSQLRAPPPMPMSAAQKDARIAELQGTIRSMRGSSSVPQL